MMFKRLLDELTLIYVFKDSLEERIARRAAH